ncbi:EI24 domain-containing protein [Jeongeupia wiesaeckerbachi]|uniref:EI24 domain-containing protein n=1 Tax=Jeongeupia wiesaeckerbachi TaxID=3051218 RepID=UPI003D802B78
MSGIPASADKLAPPLAPGEVLHCVRLGLRDSVRPRLLAVSLGVWLGTLLVLAILYALAWTPITAALDAASRFLVLGIPHWFGWVPDPASLIGRIAAGLITVVQYVLGLIGFVLSTLLVARVILETVLMGQVQRVVLRRYPALEGQVQRPWRADLRDLLGNLGTLVAGTLLCLCIPLIGAALLVLLSAYLNVRGLVNDAFDGVVSAEQQRAFVRQQRGQMLLAGLLLAGLALIPFVALLMPGMLGATSCHLGFRWLERQDN